MPSQKEPKGRWRILDRGPLAEKSPPSSTVHPLGRPDAPCLGTAHRLRLAQEKWATISPSRIRSIRTVVSSLNSFNCVAAGTVTEFIFAWAKTA